MSAGFIVIPFGDPVTGSTELRELAAEMQSKMAERLGAPALGLPFISHWIDHPYVVQLVAQHLHGNGHSAPDCEVCP